MGWHSLWLSSLFTLAFLLQTGTYYGSCNISQVVKGVGELSPGVQRYAEIFLNNFNEGYVEERHPLSLLRVTEDGTKVTSLSQLEIIKNEAQKRVLQKSPLEKVKIINQWVRGLKGVSQIEINAVSWSHLSLSLNELWKEFGFQRLLGPYDFTLRPQSLVVDNEVLLSKTLSHLGVIFYSHNKTYTVHGVEIPKSFIFASTHHSLPIVLLQCQSPNAKKLLGFEKLAKEVVYIRHCDDERGSTHPLLALHWQALLSGAYFRFAENNPQLEMKVYHLPSVRLALKWGLSQLVQLSPESVSSMRLQRLFGWNLLPKKQRGQLVEVGGPLPVLKLVRLAYLDKEDSRFRQSN